MSLAIAKICYNWLRKVQISQSCRLTRVKAFMLLHRPDFGEGLFADVAHERLVPVVTPDVRDPGSNIQNFFRRNCCWLRRVHEHWG